MQAIRLNVGLLLIGAAFQCSALTIGRPAGSAWIGKPLDLVIPLELDRSESGDSLCLEADVLQGDARLDDRRVTISLDPGPNPDAPRVRLRTTRAVEEPVVTVKLTAGCVTKSTRQYVLLADLPEAPPVMASPSRLAPSVSAAQESLESPSSAPVFSSQARSARADRAAAGAGSGAAADGSASVVRPAPQPRRRVAAASSQPATGAEGAAKPKQPAAKPSATAQRPASEPKPRLQIDALAPEPPAQNPRPALAPGNAAAASGAAAAVAAAAPASTPSAGAQPATAVPAAGAPAADSGVVPPAADGEGAGSSSAAAALAAATGQGRRDADRLKEMEATLATLREQSAQNQRQLLELRGNLAQAEANRYRNPVMYGLLALLVLALLALLALWRQARTARQSAWWGAVEEDPIAASLAAKQPLPRRGELADDDDADDGDVETGLDSPADVSGLRSAAQGLRVTALPAGVGASAFQGAPARAVNAEQLFDIQQQSDFFMSLGQHDQAVGVLREHIAASPGTSAMAYLDLLDLLKSLDRRTDYAAVAREFGHAFNVAAPDFDQFTSGDRGLEHYPDVLLHIVEKWPSQGTADLIEAFVFRKPGSPEDVFDLPAYQDLLLLYAVARDLGEYAGPWDVPQELPVAPPVAVPPASAEHVHQQTVPMPYLPSEPADKAPVAPAAQEYGAPSLELDLSDLDRTAFETLRAPIEPAQPAPKSTAAPAVDPHLIDFDPFDPDTTQGELRARHLGVKR